MDQSEQTMAAINSRGFKRLFSASRLKAYRESFTN